MNRSPKDERAEGEALWAHLKSVRRDRSEKVLPGSRGFPGPLRCQVGRVRILRRMKKPITISRKWEWDPKTDTVSYEGKDNEGNPIKVTYKRSQLSSQSDVVKTQVDPLFFNDQYWLLFPLHVAWDTSAKVTDEGMQKLPVGEGSAERIVVKYPGEGGYLPGDTWELYVGADHRVEELNFHRGGATKPSNLIATWADYKKVGPLNISTDHRGTADGAPVRIYISDLSVKVAGSDNWMNAQ